MKLYTAVIKEIKEKKKFSAYDITKSLRDKVNDKKINIDDIEDLTLSSGDISKEISHKEVNIIITEVFLHKIVELKRNYTTTGAYYFLYELVENSVAAAIHAINPNANKPNPVTMPTNSFLPKPLNPILQNNLASHFTAISNKINSLPKTSDPLKDKIKSYVEGKKKSGKTTTLWNIQKAIKAKGTKVGKIANICTTLGYKVVKTGSYYRSEVK